MLIGLVANDAGGAKILSNYVKINKQNYIFFLKGPSKKIFEVTLKKKIKNNFNLNLLKNCDLVITGTGSSNHEINGIKKSKEYGVKVVSFLDHWVKYKNRFKKNKEYIYPNEIWTGDRYSFEKAKSDFQKVNVKIRIKNNPYFVTLKKNINLRIKKKHLLYVSSARQSGGVTDLKIFKKLLRVIPFLNLKCKKIIFKLHPTEDMKKYRYVLNSISTNYQITIIKDDRLEYLVKSSEAVFGCNSMALVVALKLKIKTYNCIFYKNMVSMLPYNNINVLNEKN